MLRLRNRAGQQLPVLGQGTWEMGNDPARRPREIEALRVGLDLGLTLIDTAEMYADGNAEKIVAEAIAGRRDEVFLVSKVLPQNASATGTLAAAERSLARLRTDRLDLYLLHWPGSHPLEDTYAAFERLVQQGKIRAYGVSNFDLKAMERSEKTPGGRNVAANQILYNLNRRGAGRRLVPWCMERRITVMAYSPLDQGGLGTQSALSAIAARHGCTPHQVALAWVLGEPGMVTIPKAATAEHVRANAAAAALELTSEDRAELDRAFPAPLRDLPLETS